MNDLQKALDNFRLNAPRYERFSRYYNGDHDLAFATEKFQNTFGTLFREFALNLCPVVCDAMRDKLRIRGVGSANDIWSRSRMALRCGEVHKEALRSGDAYVIVWPDAAGRATLFPNRAASIFVQYDDENAGQLLWAAKWWPTRDKHVRVNLFYPDRVERYVSKTETEVLVADAKTFLPFSGVEMSPTRAGGLRSDAATLSNPYGVVPVFHFANNADVGDLGRSELEAAIPIQDGLNKSVLDMLVAMEFAAYRQRWAAGIEIEFDADGKKVSPFKAGVEHLWMSENPQATFGDFAAADLEQFLKVKDSFRIDIASVTGTPLHYFLQESRGFASGVSLRQNETRFNAKVRDRQASFGQTWEDAMKFGLRIEGVTDPEFTVEWEDPA
ncbi:MAG TPA: phage portal protein [Pyrinomonadaceae bacterium]|nr:phage portal protein [Pyrinomonadaceae bacterium]